uniref:Uncharacterized protein n=1 Tax=Anolis carolinensis TaxID=28377 RepID=A0A803SSJ2_ANOCA
MAGLHHLLLAGQCHFSSEAMEGVALLQGWESWSFTDERNMERGNSKHQNNSDPALSPDYILYRSHRHQIRITTYR